MAVTKDRVSSAAGTARPYIDRALRDDEFRQNLRTAFAAARAIYEELGSQRGLTAVASRMATDEDVQSNLRRAITELRLAADRLQATEREVKRSHTMRNLGLLFAGVVIGIFFNPFTGPDTRRWVKGKVVGESNGRPGHTGDNGSPNSGSTG